MKGYYPKSDPTQLLEHPPPRDFADITKSATEEHNKEVQGPSPALGASGGIKSGSGLSGASAPSGVGPDASSAELHKLPRDQLRILAGNYSKFWPED